MRTRKNFTTTEIKGNFGWSYLHYLGSNFLTFSVVITSAAGIQSRKLQQAALLGMLA